MYNAIMPSLAVSTSLISILGGNPGLIFLIIVLRVRLEQVFIDIL